MKHSKKLPFPLHPPFAVLGYGVEGSYTVDFLQRHDLAPITVIDQHKIEGAPHEVMWELPKNGWGNLTSFNTVFRSPGVHYNAPELQDARDSGINVTSLTELTFEYARNHITAITGSNGKTTTTKLMAHLLQQKYGDKMILGGNDHEPVLQKVLDRPIDPVVMEVSSFQFADLKISPHIAAILNITPNHLDWHETIDDYVNAKRNLIEHQKSHDWAVLNWNDENSRRCEERVKGNLIWIGKNKGAYWVMWQDSKLIAHFNHHDLQIINKKDLRLKTHSYNIAFATALALIHGLTPNQIQQGLKSFKGIEHRLEYVEEKKGVKFYNDSACTTPESAQVAIGQFEDGKLILLLGGSPKEAEFDYLTADIKKHQVRVLLYGQEADRIKTALQSQNAEELILNKDYKMEFELLIQKAFELANPGDNIVLSPACASFDLFKNAKVRGEKFKRIVSQIL